MIPAQVASLLNAHIAAVDRRVGDGPYVNESMEVRAAVIGARTMWDHLELRQTATPLNHLSGKPQVLLAASSPMHGEVVLKVYGRRRPHEAAVQTWWRQHGVSTVPVLAYGDHPVSWLLMTRVQRLNTEQNDALQLTRDLASVMAQAHAAPRRPALPDFTLAHGVARHLRVVSQIATEHGYSIPDGCFDIAEQLYRSGLPVTLHGDLASANLLQGNDGRICVIDTCGYLGPPEFDAARWCARIGGSRNAESLLDLWIEAAPAAPGPSTGARPALDRVLARRLLGAELVMEAGVREIVKVERSQSWVTGDPDTSDRVELGWELMCR